MADVFLSYASEDRDRVVPLVAALQAEHLSVWWDRDIGIGTTYDQEIERQLNDARCVIVVWSMHAVESDWVKNEAQEGYDRGVLVPVRIDDVRPPLAFRRLQTADLSGAQAFNGAMAGVIASVLALVGRARAPTSGEGAPAPSEPRLKKRPAAAVWMLGVLAILLGLVGFWYLQRPAIPPSPPADVAPSVAIEAFTPSPATPDVLRLATAVGTDIRTALADTDLRLVDTASTSATADFILSGSVRQLGDGVLVSLELKQSTDQRVVWADRLTQKSIDPAAPEYLRAPLVAQMVARTALVSTARATVLAAGQVDPRAVNAFFDGISEVNRIELLLGGNWRVAVDLFERAAQFEPDGASPYYRLLNAYVARFGDTISWAEASPKAHEYLRRYLAVVPEGRFWPGMVHLLIDLDFEAAAADFDEAGAVANIAGARCLLESGRGRLRAAVQYCEAAASRRGDPTALRQLGWMLIYAGRYQDARDVLTRAVNAGGEGDMVALVLKGYAEIYDGDLATAAQTLDRAFALYGDDDPSLFIDPFAMLGRTDDARRILAETLRREDAGTRVLVGMTSIFLGLYRLGEFDQAVEFMKRGIENREISLIIALRCDPNLQRIWTDPRFSEALAALEAL